MKDAPINLPAPPNETESWSIHEISVLQRYARAALKGTPGSNQI